MRKVTSQVVTAFLAGRPKKVGNTYTNGFGLSLHGNRIAEFSDAEPNKIRFTLAGWPTPTTRERLNAIPGVGIFQRKGEQYAMTPAGNSMKLDPCRWYSISDLETYDHELSQIDQ